MVREIIVFFFSFRIEMQHFGVKVSIVEHGFFKGEEVNSDIIEKYLFKLWNRLTPEIRDSYGEEYLVECKYEKEWKFGGDIINIYKYLNWGCKDNRAKPFLELSRDRTRGNGHTLKHRRLLLNISVWGWLRPGTGCPGYLWSPSFWRYSKAIWTRPGQPGLGDSV